VSRVRLVPIIFIVIISLAVLFGGWQAYQRFNFVSPLESSLNTITGVKNVNVVAGSPNVITVQLGRVGDLQTTYTALSKAVGTPGELKIKDSRNAQLTNDEEALAPIISTGKSKGDYTAMMTQIASKASSLHINVRATMDMNNIYLQITSGSYYLYDVFPYVIHQGGGN